MFLSRCASPSDVVTHQSPSSWLTAGANLTGLPEMTCARCATPLTDWPVIDPQAFRYLAADLWEPFFTAIQEAPARRSGLDLLCRVLLDLAGHFGCEQGLSVLDAGRNNGFLAFSLATRGFPVTCVQTETAGTEALFNYRDLPQECRPARMALSVAPPRDISASNTRWDILTLIDAIPDDDTAFTYPGYPEDDPRHAPIHSLFGAFWHRINLAVYLECPISDPRHAGEQYRALLHDHLSAHGPWAMTHIGHTIGNGGYQRQLLRFERI